MKPIPSSTEIQKAIEKAHAQFAAVKTGANANYIPYLAKINPELFGIAVVTARGDCFSIGDADTPFAIESISKAFNLALVLSKIGPAELRKKIGADPTGEPFNSVVAIELHQGKPLNPLVNAGAMSTVSLVPGDSPDAVWNNIISNLSDFAGTPLSVNNDVYTSESKTNQHNRGIAWLLDSYGYLYNDVEMTVDLYTRMCSVSITTKNLALMGACYANGGKNPITKKIVAQPDIIPPLLSELCMSGLYDSTGDWMYAAGVPGKSGVGGGLVAIIPGCLALAAYAPPLDPQGNSVRAQLALINIINNLKLNLFKEPALA